MNITVQEKTKPSLQAEMENNPSDFKQIRLREFPIVHSEVPATLRRERFTGCARAAQQYPEVQNHAHPTDQLSALWTVM